ncbi:MAG: 3-hydroxyacyl-CoA dehydrogenase [Phycisphaerae bacterium]|nr:3-hydroxyacyl-CoA dehydrogenase [Phycisphaerae bacterium]
MTVENEIAILGTGAMGAGIAQVAAIHGWSVRMIDCDPETAAKAKDGIGTRLQRQVEKGRISESEAGEAMVRLHIVQSDSELDSCEVLLEAIVEDMEIKTKAVAPLLDHLHSEAIIATNTSSLSVTELGQKLGCPSRVVGMHFFNPAPIMKLVEVIRGRETDPVVVDRIAEIASSWNKHVAVAADTPGFIVNRVARPYYLEAFRCMEDGLATADLIDETMRSLGGFRMGPFELTDFIGHDVNTATTRTVWDCWNRPTRLAPSLMQEQLVAEGRLGKKSGTGVYDWSTEPPSPTIHPSNEASTVPGFDMGSIMKMANQLDLKCQNPIQTIVFARILFAILNEALWAQHDGVAEAADIDTAMQYGVNYPIGPFKWMEDIGLDLVKETMKSLESMTGDGRFITPD